MVYLLTFNPAPLSNTSLLCVYFRADVAVYLSIAKYLLKIRNGDEAQLVRNCPNVTQGEVPTTSLMRCFPKSSRSALTIGHQVHSVMYKETGGLKCTFVDHAEWPACSAELPPQPRPSLQQ